MHSSPQNKHRRPARLSVSRALPKARGPGPPPRAYRDAGTPHGSAAIRFVDYMLGLAALLILHCRLIGSNPFHPSRRPLAAILPLFLLRVQLPIPLGLNLPAGGPSLHCTIATEGAPSLRFLQEPALSLPKGWVTMLPAQLCPFYTTRCLCRRRTRPSPTRRTGQPLLWWLLQFESRATRPAQP